MREENITVEELRKREFRLVDDSMPDMHIYSDRHSQRWIYNPKFKTLINYDKHKK